MADRIQYPDVKKPAKSVKAPKKRGQAIDISILGHRDPRGPDNNIYVWVDEDDKLHIRVQKTERCYKFKEVIQTPGFVEVVAE